jgi:hypothetical protein
MRCARCLLLLGSLMLMAESAKADTILPDSKPAGITWVRDDTPYYPNYRGYGFTVGDVPLTVTELGVWDGPGNATTTMANGTVGDGLQYSNPVKLFSYDGTNYTLLDSVSIQAGTASTLVGEFRFESLATPITLDANQTYVLYPVTQIFYDNGAQNIAQPSSPYVTLNWGVMGNSTAPNGSHYFINDGSARVFVGANAMFTPAPEPGALVLCGTGLIGLLAYAWRKRR